MFSQSHPGETGIHRGALIFQFLVAFSGFNLSLAELNGSAERMLVGGHCFHEVRDQLFIFF